MNEASVTTSFRTKLIANGFLVKKLADKTTVGLPDCFIVKDALTVFIETKYFELKVEPTVFKEFSKIPIDNQLMLMVELQKKGAHALYNFIYNLPESKLVIATIKPLGLFYCIKNSLPIVLPTLYTFDQWISRFENRLLPL